MDLCKSKVETKITYKGDNLLNLDDIFSHILITYMIYINRQLYILLVLPV